MWMYIMIDLRKKGKIKMEKKSIAYEYKTLTVSRKLELQWRDGLEKFGWKLVVSSPDQRFQDRQTAASTGVTALMGITEPVLYGLNLPKKYPLAASMIGGALGGLYAGITHTHRFATGSSGIPAVLLYIGDDTMRYFYNIIIALIITAVSTAVITFVLSLKYEKKPETAEPEKVLENPAEAKNSGAKEEDLGIYAPVKGKTAAMESIPDETFSSGVLGKRPRDLAGGGNCICTL